MSHTTEPTDSQKTIITALDEGWQLRQTGKHGWCLFQVGRQRPFGKVRSKTVERMTRAGWLTTGMYVGPDETERKDLTALGQRIANELALEEWADHFEWDPSKSRTADDAKPSPDDDTSDLHLRDAA